MGLEMKGMCEKCQRIISGNAYICIHECTFCEECANEMSCICPNCIGELVKRPKPNGSCPIS
ncbi:DUF1272 domain-containing protein [Virgibacillus halodenitrificans]|uniref:DUF1272 domain-containing protein n=1 Tax=Virgibacillus halodenitrificans TaxID=1482 RepID=UPI00036942C5|nr:DUF1272 domain-containing protein [Virgibacillus halodenitrificans]